MISDRTYYILTIISAIIILAIASFIFYSMLQQYINNETINETNNTSTTNTTNAWIASSNYTYPYTETISDYLNMSNCTKINDGIYCEMR